MNYLAAKAVLLKGSPQIQLKVIAIEAVALVCVAGILVQIFT